MPLVIQAPTVIRPAGNKPKRIEEFVGRVNSGPESVSVARMVTPRKGGLSRASGRSSRG